MPGWLLSPYKQLQLLVEQRWTMDDDKVDLSMLADDEHVHLSEHLQALVGVAGELSFERLQLVEGGL